MRDISDRFYKYEFYLWLCLIFSFYQGVKSSRSMEAIIFWCESFYNNQKEKRELLCVFKSDTNPVNISGQRIQGNSWLQSLGRIL